MIAEVTTQDGATIRSSVSDSFARASYPAFIREFNGLADDMNAISTEHGFWEDDKDKTLRQVAGEKIALMHSELSEALEAIRSGNPADEKIPELSNFEVELADCVIRIMDLAGQFGLNIGEAIIKKARFNANRPFKHGKEF